MRGFKSISLLLVFLFGTFVPGQVQEELTRLPVLWKHYQLHKTETPGTTFSQYLKLHYGDGFAKHRSAHDHSKLPMKSGDHHLHAPVPVDLPEMLTLVSKASNIGCSTPVFVDQSYDFLLTDNIWQPPKPC